LLVCAFGCASSSSPSLPDAALVARDGAADTAADGPLSPDASFADAGLDGPVAACAPSGGGSAWAVWRIKAPAAREYDTTSADVVVATDTTLMWQRRAAPDQLAWEDAKSYCACLRLGGHDDWRLPSRMELLSIVDYTRADPAIDPKVFPETPDTWFWSASPVAADPQEAWYLSFMDGNTHEASTDVMYGVRCVRNDLPARAAYQIGSGTAVDPGTHLTWQQTIDATPRSWDQARAYCDGLALASGGWRLPTMYELQTLIDEKASAPAIDARSFPDTPAEGFWASTPLAGMPGYWFVSFDRGVAYNAVADHLYRVRCVR
jgi:hypothetical protein